MPLGPPSKVPFHVQWTDIPSLKQPIGSYHFNEWRVQGVFATAVTSLDFIIASTQDDFTILGVSF